MHIFWGIFLIIAFLIGVILIYIFISFLNLFLKQLKKNLSLVPDGPCDFESHNGELIAPYLLDLLSVKYIFFNILSPFISEIYMT